MQAYALTINPGHISHSYDISDVANFLAVNYQPQYCEIVCHDNDHYHVLLFIEDVLIKDKNTPFHFETVRQLKAYQKYMHSHDVTDEISFGDLPYYEDDNIIDYLLTHSPADTVKKYGWKVLKNYANVKKFYDDINIMKGN